MKEGKDKFKKLEKEMLKKLLELESNVFMNKLSG